VFSHGLQAFSEGTITFYQQLYEKLFVQKWKYVTFNDSTSLAEHKNEEKGRWIKFLGPVM